MPISKSILTGLGAALGVWACLAVFPVQAAQSGGDAKRGESVYMSKCTGCHSLAENRTGPMHRGVYGRKAGAVQGYDYSPALARSGITWDAASLDKWLTDPEKFVSGQKMFFSVEDEKDRADIIAYLKSVS